MTSKKRVRVRRRKAPADAAKRVREPVHRPKPSNLPKVKKKKKPKHDRVALIDADILLYMATTQYLEETGPDENDEYSYVINMEYVRKELQHRVQDTMDATGATHALLATTSIHNWRKRVYAEYKKNRSIKKPLGFRAAKEWLASFFPESNENIRYLEIPHLEADDILGLHATHQGRTRKLFDDALSKTFDTVVCGDDKDFKTIPGQLWNCRKPDLGIVTITPKEAVRFHLEQTLMGDMTDFVRGVRGIGPVKARSIMEDVGTSPEVWWKTVVQAYVDGNLSEKDALRTAQALRILQYDDYDFKEAKVNRWSPSQLTLEVCL